MGAREGSWGEGETIRDQTGWHLTPPELQFQLFPTGLREVQADGNCGPPGLHGVVWCGMARGRVHAWCDPGWLGAAWETFYEHREAGARLEGRLHWVGSRKP